MDRLLALRATTPVVDTLAAILDPINGTVRGLARFRTGVKVKEFTEAPWGDAVADTGLVVRYHFAGREYDSESGLYYMRARYYDPALGRWISEDPIGIAGGMNVYAYAGNDPVNGRDPSGLDPDCKPIPVPPGPGQIPGIGQECRNRWNPMAPGGPLDWLDPKNRCGMETFYKPECSGYPDQDVLDYYSGLGGATSDKEGSSSSDPLAPTAGPTWGQCISSHLGINASGLAIRGVVGVNAIPLPKRLLGVPRLPGTSAFTNPLSASRYLTGDVRMAAQAFGTRSVSGMLGRANWILFTGIAAYDATSVLLCKYSGDPDYEP